MPIKLDYYYQRFHKSIPHASNYPIITNVQGTSAGLITWTTDVASTSQVLYGLVPYMGYQSDYDSTLVTSHAVQLSVIDSNATHYFKVQSFHIDALSISDLYSFISGGAASYSAFILRSPDLTRWGISVTTNGNLDSEPTPTGPAVAYEPISITFQDSGGAFWALTIDDTGHLITTSLGGSPTDAIAAIPLLDPSFHTWQLTVSPEGNLTTT